MARPTFAKKSLGQNFLVDPNYVRKIMGSRELVDSDTVIEIGSGRGAITEHLVESGANVIAVELDRDFVPMLRERFSAADNFSITEADATRRKRSSKNGSAGFRAARTWSPSHRRLLGSRKSSA
jgi:16S rRNA A1518/A1519 N6-dimethyltransferase RsmA/KsgA/DIM1 with predicted DNA glycosylase/AP lyase activity